MHLYFFSTLSALSLHSLCILSLLYYSLLLVSLFLSLLRYDVDDVIIAAGTEQEEGIFVVQSGKCDVVHGLALKDHALELQEDLDNMHHELMVGLSLGTCGRHFYQMYFK